MTNQSSIATPFYFVFAGCEKEIGAINNENAANGEGLLHPDNA